MATEMPSIQSSQQQQLNQNEQYDVPIAMGDVSVFDGAFTFMKQRFCEEMKRMEDEINNFSKNLSSFTTKAIVNQAGTVSKLEIPSTAWDVITSSPLVEGEGEDRMMRLQFDVSIYEPEEITVNIIDDILVVLAQHNENTDGGSTNNQYRREFALPKGTDPGSVKPTLSKDGILTIRAPLNLTVEKAP